MKWAVAQLRKMKMPYHFEDTIDLKSDLMNIEDVLDVMPGTMTGICTMVGFERFHFDFTVNIMLILRCSVSLEPVPYELNLSLQETFSHDESYSSDIIIEKNTIDLREIVLSEIVVSIPMKVVKEGFEDMFEESTVDPEEIGGGEQ